MQISNNQSLRQLNTFALEVNSRHFSRIENPQDVSDLLEWKSTHDLPLLLIGGGSNLLFRENYPGLVAQINLKGKKITGQATDGTVLVRAGGGENWHRFVRWTIDQGLAGLENLSLIPGQVGAAPIQNIGAYGVELADRFEQLETVDLQTGEHKSHDREACRFAYRDSIFKAQWLDRQLITSVTFRLERQSEHTQWKIDYAGIRDKLAGQPLTAQRISDAVIQLRRDKLPDPALTGNAGSFFKNPVLELSRWESLKERYPALPGFVQPGGKMVKSSAAWLIDQCGWKGYRKGDAGVSAKHALVLVNYGNATGAEVWAIARQIMQSVEERFGVLLEAEPRIIGPF